MRQKIELVTMKDVTDFVRIASSLNEKVILTDGSGYTVSAKSMLGALYSLEWSETYIECENDISFHFRQFIK